MGVRGHFCRTGPRRWAPIVAVSILVPSSVSAEESRADGSAGCREPLIAAGIAETVLDGRTFRLADGREIRLAGIEIPPSGFGRVPPGAGEHATAAVQALTGGKSIALRRSGIGADRYGRLVGQVFVTGAASELWVQAELVANGHALVADRVGHPVCAAELLRRERAARAAKLGLWAEPYYVIRKAEDSAALMAERGRFAIVEGDVLSVRESGGTIYVNFSRRWTDDFTVTIAKRNERMISAHGVEPRLLPGRRIRVRGWIEERGGPWIEVARPEQIEVVERTR